MAGEDVWGSKNQTWGLEDFSTDDEPVRSIDPVCGAVVEEPKASAKIGYAGEMFYFCSEECKEKFIKNPGEFIGERQ